MRVLPVLLLAAIPTLAADHPGAAVYRTKMCKVCHGTDGSGNKSTGVKDLRSDEVQNKSDDDLIATVTNGKGKMPAFKSSLSAQQIRDVVGYLRTLKK